MNRNAKPTKPLLFTVLWFAVTAAGFTVSGVIFHFPGSFPPNNGEAFNPAGINGALVNGLATGIVVGVGQMLLLRLTDRSSWRWAVGTAAALLLIHIIGDVFPDSFSVLLMAVFGGLLLAGGQWWALRLPLRDGLLWVGGSAVAWAVALLLGLQLTAGADWRIEHTVVGVLTGLLVGAVTASIWAWRLFGSTSAARGRVLRTGAP
ncbi:hypothetical protein F8G81_00925 [Arthrobacter sp. CDRTa11]|uniref:hypothetical protein n=1 Tax=Arthrobacter sp. CDRTa11 TaxID=2651199 RepID=UPI002265C494|nr:hypothetical protein [Arthrobacter sp. CDRTa11]UZX01339.1 hypothetical protein F8G81_00925 [Arthrobacter sp. CDRTa11]